MFHSLKWKFILLLQALPKTFSDNLKNKLPANVTLKGPSGVVWDIGLTTRDDKVYSTDGWQQFVKDHSLKQNDFLVFKYNGESLFEVLIFHGESFCEKAASYFILERGQAHTEQGGRKAKYTDTSNGGVECGLLEKSWEEDIYWTHFQFIHFTQFLRTDFEQQLVSTPSILVSFFSFSCFHVVNKIKIKIKPF